ncbi:MAG: hypothetical protein ACIAQZ_00905 [Sedimentisphaeraceae bacterium JB056]
MYKTVLAILFLCYGLGYCFDPNTADTVMVYDSQGFESFTTGDINGQNLWVKPYGQPYEAGAVVDLSSVGGVHDGRGNVLSFIPRTDGGTSQLKLNLGFTGDFSKVPVPRDVNVLLEFDMYQQGNVYGGMRVNRAIDSVVQLTLMPQVGNWGLTARKGSPEAANAWANLGQYDKTSTAPWYNVKIYMLQPEYGTGPSKPRLRIYIDDEEITGDDYWYGTWDYWQGYIGNIDFYAVNVPTDGEYYIDNLKVYQDAALPMAECGENGYYAGDFNKDCYVNLQDLQLFVTNWLLCTQPGGENCLDIR